MIRHHSYNELGKANHGWLKSRHHFSFANYYEPSRMGFGLLRVINDDWVEPGAGFAPHPHKNMEIISYIRSGAISHQDSTGNTGIIQAGEVQVMSAGSGIVHSEYNRTNKDLVFYQIWIESNQHNVKPRWESKMFPTNTLSTKLQLLVSGYAEDRGDALFIYQTARLFGGKIKKGTKIKHDINHQAYVLASEGSFALQDNTSNCTLNKGDGADVSQTNTVAITALSDCEVVLIDAPMK
ncbi:MAG: pirin family protein [Spongiibacteraceae bacterium]|nr:pirin family protein [Spongiibacteraceae bacterium]